MSRSADRGRACATSSRDGADGSCSRSERIAARSSFSSGSRDGRAAGLEGDAEDEETTAADGATGASAGDSGAASAAGAPPHTSATVCQPSPAARRRAASVAGIPHVVAQCSTTCPAPRPSRPRRSSTGDHRGAGRRVEPMRISTERSMEGEVCVRPSSTSGATISPASCQKRASSSPSLSRTRCPCSCVRRCPHAPSCRRRLSRTPTIASTGAASVLVSAARKSMSSSVGTYPAGAALSALRT